MILKKHYFFFEVLKQIELLQGQGGITQEECYIEKDYFNF